MLVLYFYSLATESKVFEKNGVVLKRTVFFFFFFFFFFFLVFFLSLLLSRTSHTSLTGMVFELGGSRFYHFFLYLHLYLHLDFDSGFCIFHNYRRRLQSSSSSSQSPVNNSSSSRSFTACSPYREDGWRPSAANTGDDTSTCPGTGDEAADGAGAGRGF